MSGRCGCLMAPMRLTSLTVRDVPGLPDVDLALQPMTALVGPRGAGKSRLLNAISWLLTGSPGVNGSLTTGAVSGDLVGNGTSRRIKRARDFEPVGPLPPVIFLAARDRVPAPPDAPPGARSDAAPAELMVAAIAERRLAGVEGEVLLIEEPELMLTPQQQRHLHRLLRRYAEHNQVIYSTREPAMLDATHFHEIIRLDRTSAGTKFRRVPRDLLTDEERVRLGAQFDHERNEMFFANAVVLVEGQTERMSLPLIFERLGHDPDALGISIVEVGGKGNLGLVAQVLAELRIPHVIVFDADRGHPAEMENAEIRRRAGGVPVFELKPDFEAAARIQAHDDKVYAAWKRFTKIAPERIPAVFRKLVEATVELANDSRA